MVAIPAIGQIFPGNLLLLPDFHVETLARLPAAELSTVDRLVSLLGRTVSDNSRYITFEHGATRLTGGSCGIYHAHLHVVPVPHDSLTQDLLPAGSTLFATHSEALASLSDSSEYLLLGVNRGVRTVSLSGRPNAFPSQYFRRRLVEIFRLARPWDWRIVNEPEVDVLKTIDLFHRQCVRGIDI